LARVAHKWVLRRFDHSAIYLLIAATYTPFMAQVKNGPVASAMLAIVWTVAAIGMVMKLTLPGRFDRLSTVLYLLLGWSGVMMRDVIAALPACDLVASRRGRPALIRWGSSSISGQACASRMRSGMRSWSLPLRATIVPCWTILPWREPNKRPGL